MKQLLLAAIGAALLFAAVSAPSLIARQQSAVSFEYLRLAPYSGPMLLNGRQVLTTDVGLRACVAAAADWSCRGFGPPQSSPEIALRTALFTLGSEGWELVSAGHDTEGRLNRGR